MIVTIDAIRAVLGLAGLAIAVKAAVELALTYTRKRQRPTSESDDSY